MATIKYRGLIGEYGTVFKDFDREIYKVKNASETLSSTIFKSKKK